MPRNPICQLWEAVCDSQLLGRGLPVESPSHLTAQTSACLPDSQGRQADRGAERRKTELLKKNTRSRRFAQPRWPSRTIILSLQAANDRRCFGGRSNLHAIMMNVANIPLAIRCLYHFHKHQDGSFTMRLQCFCQKSMHLH